MAKIPSAQMHLKLEDLASNKGLSKESEEIPLVFTALLCRLCCTGSLKVLKMVMNEARRKQGKISSNALPLLPQPKKSPILVKWFCVV